MAGGAKQEMVFGTARTDTGEQGACPVSRTPLALDEPARTLPLRILTLRAAQVIQVQFAEFID